MKPRTSRNIALAAVAVILVVTFACCMMIPGDPDDRPVLPVATATTNGGAQARLSDCDSEWTYYYEGRETTATAHKIDPYATYDDDGRGWPAALDVTEPTRASISFDVPPTEVSAMRWDEGDIDAHESMRASDISVFRFVGTMSEPEQEDVAAALEDNGTVSLTVEPGYRYALDVSFEDGWVIYAFTTK